VETLLMQHEQTGTHPKEVFSLLVSELWHQRFVDSSARPPELIQSAPSSPLKSVSARSSLSIQP
jgi:hypothetical protein